MVRIIKGDGVETNTQPAIEESIKKVTMQERVAELEKWRESFSKSASEEEKPKKEGITLRRKIMIGLLLIIAIVILVNFYQIVILGYELPF